MQLLLFWEPDSDEIGQETMTTLGMQGIPIPDRFDANEDEDLVQTMSDMLSKNNDRMTKVMLHLKWIIIVNLMLTFFIMLWK